MLSLPREAKVNTTIKLAIHADWCQMHKNKGHHSLSWAQEANVCKVATGSPPNHCKIKRIKVVFWNCQSKGSFFFFQAKQERQGRAVKFCYQKLKFGTNWRWDWKKCAGIMVL